MTASRGFVKRSIVMCWFTKVAVRDLKNARLLWQLYEIIRTPMIYLIVIEDHLSRAIVEGAVGTHNDVIQQAVGDLE